MKSTSIAIAAAFAVLFVALNASSAQGQLRLVDSLEDAPPTETPDPVPPEPPKPTDDAKQDLINQTAYYKALGEYYKARKAAKDAVVPDATLPGGTLTVTTGDVPMSVWTGVYAGHTAALALTDPVAAAIENRCPRVLLRAPDAVVNARGRIALIDSTITDVQATRAAKPGPVVAFGGGFPGKTQAIAAALDSAVHILKYFRQDVTATVGTAKLLDGRALVEDLAGQLVPHLPAVAFIEPVPSGQDAHSAMQRITALRTAIGKDLGGDGNLEKLQQLTATVLQDTALLREADVADTCLLGMTVRTESHAAVTRQSAFWVRGSNEATATVAWSLLSPGGKLLGGGSLVSACHTPAITRRSDRTLVPTCSTLAN